MASLADQQHLQGLCQHPVWLDMFAFCRVATRFYTAIPYLWQGDRWIRSSMDRDHLWFFPALPASLMPTRSPQPLISQVNVASSLEGRSGFQFSSPEVVGTESYNVPHTAFEGGWYHKLQSCWIPLYLAPFSLRIGLLGA